MSALQIVFLKSDLDVDLIIKTENKALYIYSLSLYQNGKRLIRCLSKRLQAGDGGRWEEKVKDRHVCELFPVVMSRIESCLLTHTETIVFCICGNQCHQLQSLPVLH